MVQMGRLKRKILLLVVFMITLTFCGKDIYLSQGTIIGPDLRMCACCGGWYILIDTTTYEFESLPLNSKIDLQSETFPLNVKLDWEISDRVACPNKYITILRIEK
jgi:hypothetical protein